MTAKYSVPSNPSVKWAPTGVPHTNFAGRIENFTFERMDPAAGRELLYRRYAQPESDQGSTTSDNDDSGIGASASGSDHTATAGGGTAVAGPSRVLEDGSLPVANIHDWSTYTFPGESQPYKFPGEDRPLYLYVGDLPPKVQIDERNIPPLRRATRYIPEQPIDKKISVPPGFEFKKQKVSVPPGFEEHTKVSASPGSDQLQKFSIPLVLEESQRKVSVPPGFEQQQRKVSVPPGFEKKFGAQAENILFHMRELKSSSSGSDELVKGTVPTNVFGSPQKIDWSANGKMIDDASPSHVPTRGYGQLPSTSATASSGQHNIDRKGKGKMVDEPSSASTSETGAHGQHLSSFATPSFSQLNIDWKGKGKMIEEVSPSHVPTRAYGQPSIASATTTHGQQDIGQHGIDWKSKGKEIIFEQTSSSGGSGSSLEMTETKAGPPPKLSEYPAEQTQEEASAPKLPYGHVETYTYVSFVLFRRS